MEDNKEAFRKLPKNIRQIGEIEDMVKIYIEDYASIYLKKLRPSSGQGLKIGLLLGDSMINEGVPYIFIEGAMEIDGLEATPGEIAFSNEIWSAAYEAAQKYFPGLSIQGWFICGSLDVKLDPLAMWSLHTRYFPGKNQILYLSPTYEVDESLYVTSVNGFYKANGHNIYYERNELMQDYMILRKESQKIEAEVDDRVIRNFRTVMEEKKKEEVSKNKTVNLLYTACTFLTLVVFAIGITMINTHDKMKSMEAAVVSLTQNTNSDVEVIVAASAAEEMTSEEKTEAGVIINEIPGQVYQTEPETAEAETETTAFVDDEDAEEAGAIPADDESEGQAGEAAEDKESEADIAADETQLAEEEEPTAAIASNNVDTGKVHTVSRGETLYTISLKYYQSLNYVDRICELNELEDQDKIFIGQELQLP